MKTIILPEGNAFGADDIDSRTHYAEHPAKMLFLEWVTLSEHKWVTLRERRGPGGRKRWTIRLLTAAARECPGLANVNRETVRQMLKKTTASPGAS